jgi:hypothetical protein
MQKIPPVLSVCLCPISVSFYNLQAFSQVPCHVTRSVLIPVTHRVGDVRHVRLVVFVRARLFVGGT